MERQYSIIELARALKVNPLTVLNWENSGWIPPARREGARRKRVYTLEEAQHIARLIKQRRSSLPASSLPELNSSN
jgi:DNA-binding transcriptional MerR regulator